MACALSVYASLAVSGPVLPAAFGPRASTRSGVCWLSPTLGRTFEFGVGSLGRRCWLGETKTRSVEAVVVSAQPLRWVISGGVI